MTKQKKTLIISMVVITLFIICFKLLPINKGSSRHEYLLTCTSIESLHKSLDQFYYQNGNYPSTREGLQALISNPDITKYPKHYQLLKSLPKDAWGNAYSYFLNSDNIYTVKSYGSDGKINGKNLTADIDIHLCKEKYGFTHP